MPTSAADWVHLGPGIEESVLPVHDARLVAARSERLARTLVLTLSIDYIQEWLKAPEQLRFQFAFDGVQSVRAMAARVWPGPAPEIPAGTPREEEQRLIEQYQSKWREDSVDWMSLESSLNDDHWIDVMEGHIATAHGAVSVHLGGHLVPGTYHDLWVRAEQFNVNRSDGEPFDLDALDAAYDAYWEAFSKRGT